MNPQLILFIIITLLDAHDLFALIVKSLFPKLYDFIVSASATTEIVTLADRLKLILLKRGLAKYPSAILGLSFTVDSNLVFNLYFSALRTLFHQFIECCKVNVR